MKHIKLYEYYKPAAISNSDTVRLFRGDSDYIQEFDPNKFDTKSLFGKGTYLTSSRYVASTYTTKGDKEKVVASFYAEGRKSKSAHLKFVIMYVMGKILHPGMKTCSEKDGYNEWQKVLRDYYETMTPLHDTIFQPIDTIDPAYVSYNAQRAKDRKKYLLKAKNLQKKFGTYLEEAWAIFNKNPKRYKFIATSYKAKDNEMSWEVLDMDIKKGHISEFDVSKHILDKTCDAENRIDKQVMLLLDDVMQQSFTCTTAWKGMTVEEKVEDYQWRKDNDRSHFSNLGAFFYNSLSRQWDEMCWQSFREGMQQLGYTGIRYEGGKYTGSPTIHDAYVLWDYSKLIRVK